MSSILCLAHYCDTHGPTAILVTEAFPVGCASCYQEESFSGSRRPSTSTRSLNPSDSLSGVVYGSSSGTDGRANPTSSEKPSGNEAVGLQSTSFKSQVSTSSSSAIETPPESPRVAQLQGGHSGSLHRRDSSFRKTYDENDKKRAIPCDNCALTLPKKTKEDPVPYNKVENNGPILRTRKAYERINVPIQEPSPPKSASSDVSDSESDITDKSSSKTPYPLDRATTSSSNSSFGSASTTHDHHVDYTSSHEPLSSTSFSIIRQSCLRTLSCETLPPSSQLSSSSPTSPFMSSFSSGLSSSGSTSSGGPIFFGDALAGYTTAFLFRIPDPNARGRRRVYALMALSTHRQQRAMQTFSLLSVAFREIASWIQALAEAELERYEVTSPRLGSERGPSSNNTPTSSFLQGRNRGDGRFSGMSLRSKGLAEIVGLPDFFIELHARFVRLLAEMSLLLGS